MPAGRVDQLNIANALRDLVRRVGILEAVPGAVEPASAVASNFPAVTIPAGSLGTAVPFTAALFSTNDSDTFALDGGSPQRMSILNTGTYWATYQFFCRDSAAHPIVNPQNYSVQSIPSNVGAPTQVVGQDQFHSVTGAQLPESSWADSYSVMITVGTLPLALGIKISNLQAPDQIDCHIASIMIQRISSRSVF